MPKTQKGKSILAAIGLFLILMAYMDPTHILVITLIKYLLVVVAIVWFVQHTWHKIRNRGTV